MKETAARELLSEMIDVCYIIEGNIHEIIETFSIDPEKDAVTIKTNITEHSFPLSKLVPQPEILSGCLNQKFFQTI